MINFDANATYGVIPEVREAIRELMAEETGYGNPSSVHRDGQRSRALIEEARGSVRELVNAPSSYKIIFTSGATEANNLAIKGVCSDQIFSSVVVSNLEHPSVLEAARSIKDLNLIELEIAALRFPEKVLSIIPKDTKLLSVMLANNETGEIFPVKELIRLAKEYNPSIITHTDVVQAVGKISIDIIDLGVDLASLSAHKIGGLMGVGALLVKDGVNIRSTLHGGAQEVRLRAGTENLIGIYSFGIAAKLALKSQKTRVLRMANARNKIINSLKGGEIKSILPFEDQESIPNTLSVRFPGVRADDLIVALDLKGITVSTGAACSSGKQEVSHVLTAMGMREAEARETIRISLTGEISDQELDFGVSILLDTVKRMQSERYLERRQ